MRVVLWVDCGCLREAQLIYVIECPVCWGRLNHAGSSRGKYRWFIYVAADVFFLVDRDLSSFFNRIHYRFVRIVEMVEGMCYLGEF